MAAASAQDRVQHYIRQIDGELSKYPLLNNLEKKTTVPKAYAALGLVGVYAFFIVFNLGGQFLTNFAGFLIPGYFSLEALFTANKDDDSQWLTYWVVFALFSVLESFLTVTYWFPFYFTFKFIFLLWLSLPYTRGAEIVFRSFIVPTLGRFFVKSGSAGLRAKADSAAKTE